MEWRAADAGFRFESPANEANACAYLSSLRWWSDIATGSCFVRARGLRAANDVHHLCQSVGKLA